MKFAYTVTAEIERSEGRFASRGEMAEMIEQSLEECDPGVLDGENGGVYDVVVWEVRAA